MSRELQTQLLVWSAIKRPHSNPFVMALTRLLRPHATLDQPADVG